VTARKDKAETEAEAPFGSESDPGTADLGPDWVADADGKDEVYRGLPYAPFYIATRDLPVGTEMGAEAMPVTAFRAGDLVPAEHVEKYGWREHVSPPAPVKE
jgi:hypothetical protein